MSTSSRKVLRILLPVILIIVCILIALVIVGSAPQPEKKEEIIKAPLISTYEVSLSDQPLLMSSYGVVRPKHQTSIVAQVSGEIVELSSVFASGGKVEKGTVLAKIDPSDYKAALIEAQANLQRAKAALQEEEARGIVAKEEWRGATSKLPPALGLRKPQLAREQANLRSAQASLARAERNLDRTNIVAPYNALINSRDIDLGQFAGTGSTLGVLSSIDTAEVRLPISSTDYSYLTDTQSGMVSLTRDEGNNGISWNGKIIRDEGVIDENSRMIYIVAEVSKPYQQSPSLKFGTFVNAAIKSKVHNNIAVIPSHLYQEGYVTMVTDARQLHKQPVTLLKRDKKHVYILDGLSNGDLLLDSKIENLYEGMKVRVSGDKEPTSDKDTGAVELAAGDK